jgi:hypothetical protein
MRKQGSERNPLFVKRWFSDDMVIMVRAKVLAISAEWVPMNLWA